jgi:PTS system nitrogen regulatory IIA component
MLLNRESLGSTAIGKGVAFPHGRTLAVRDLSIVFARSAPGIDFDSVDKKPTHVFFLIIAPPQDRDNLYLQVLGRVVDLIKDDASRERISTAKSFDELKVIIEGQGL